LINSGFNINKGISGWLKCPLNLVVVDAGFQAIEGLVFHRWDHGFEFML
jgi:hypothetical protein